MGMRPDPTTPVPRPKTHTDALVTQLYRVVRLVALRALRRERKDHTLNPTALVHEAYLRLAHDRSDLPWRSSGEFTAAMANVMRQVLVDQARSKGTLRRGGSQQRITLHDHLAESQAPPLDVVQLDEGLQALARIDARKARLVELRFFGGLTVAEAAVQLSISPRVAADDWVIARAWLGRFLDGEGPAPSSRGSSP